MRIWENFLLSCPNLRDRCLWWSITYFFFFSFSQILLTKNTKWSFHVNTEGSICDALTCARCFLDDSAIKPLRSVNLTLLSLVGKPANYAFSLWSCGWPRRLQSKGFACRQQKPIAIYFTPFMRFVWARGTVIFPEPFQFITWHSDLCAWPHGHMRTVTDVHNRRRTRAERHHAVAPLA